MRCGWPDAAASAVCTALPEDAVEDDITTRWSTPADFIGRAELIA
jgi:hypothetical protein